MLLPQLEVAAKKLVKDEVRVVKIDSDKYPSWAARYQVEGLPAIILIQGGRVLDRMEGAHTNPIRTEKPVLLSGIIRGRFMINTILM